MHDRPLSPEALACVQRIMRCSVVAGLKTDADETAADVQELLALPTLPSDLTDREFALAAVILRKVEAAKRLLSQVAMPDLPDQLGPDHRIGAG